MKSARLVVLLIIGIFFLTVVTIAEEITLTTYYPAPYGEYEELRANKLGVGSGTDTTVLNDGDLAVRGKIKGDGSEITNLNASNLSSGTVPNDRINSSYYQRRVSNSCPEGSAIRAINEDGSVTCTVLGEKSCPLCQDWDGEKCVALTGYSEAPGCSSACEGCYKGVCVDMPAGQKDTIGSNTCDATHYRCDGSGSCTAPRTDITEICNTWSKFRDWKCAWICQDNGYDGCNWTRYYYDQPCTGSYDANYGCDSDLTHTKLCQCFNYVYDSP